MIRSLLESYLQMDADVHLVASIPGANQAPELCQAGDIDLVLMDVQTEHRENGLLAVRKIKAVHPRIRIVVVTSLLDFDILRQAWEYGADSLWYKDSDARTLMEVLHRTLLGERVFPDAPPSVEIGTAKSTEFTKTELKVLRCLVRGKSYSKIAEELNIEPRTVQFHVTNMLQKTNFENKLQLALAVSDAKLIVGLAEEPTYDTNLSRH